MENKYARKLCYGSAIPSTSQWTLFIKTLGFVKASERFKFLPLSIG